MAFQLGHFCAREPRAHLQGDMWRAFFCPGRAGGSLGGKEVSSEAVVRVWKSAKRSEMEMRLQEVFCF